MKKANRRKRTIIQVTWSLVAGGAEMYALTIASHLDASKYRSILCGIDQGGALEGEIKRLKIPYFIMHRREGIQIGLFWRMFRLFRRLRVDVVHTHHFNQLFYSVVGAKLCGARLIHIEHSVESYDRPRTRFALRLLSRFCDKVITVGNEVEAVMRDQIGIPQSKLAIVRAGVDLDAFDSSQNSQIPARQELGLNSSDRVAVIVARLFPEKNHRLLLRAFADVARQNPNARLLIVGEGVEQKAIEDEIARLELKDQVRMLGVRRDVALILAAADVFVLTSEREGLPIAVLEAMAASKPVVATAVGDLPAVVRDRITGRLVLNGDCAALAQALGEILDNPDAAVLWGRNGRAAVQSYSVAAMIDEYEKLYAAR